MLKQDWGAGSVFLWQWTNIAAMGFRGWRGTRSSLEAKNPVIKAQVITEGDDKDFRLLKIRLCCKAQPCSCRLYLTSSWLSTGLLNTPQLWVGLIHSATPHSSHSSCPTSFWRVVSESFYEPSPAGWMFKLKHFTCCSHTWCNTPHGSFSLYH